MFSGASRLGKSPRLQAGVVYLLDFSSLFKSCSIVFMQIWRGFCPCCQRCQVERSIAACRQTSDRDSPSAAIRSFHVSTISFMHLDYHTIKSRSIANALVHVLRLHKFSVDRLLPIWIMAPVARHDTATAREMEGRQPQQRGRTPRSASADIDSPNRHTNSLADCVSSYEPHIFVCLLS